MAKPSTPIRIAIHQYPGAQASAVHGLGDLFQVANRINRDLRPDAPGFAPEIFDYHPPHARFTVVILPPSLGDRLTGKALHATAAWILEQHRSGALVCSICAGAFLLAATGLLDGRAATTHWALAHEFAARFPDVALDTDKLVIDDGDIMTAGGLMAWVDLGLRLVDRFMGPSVMVQTARFLLFDPGGREQRFYSNFAPNLLHGDAAILKAQHWLQAHYGEPVGVARMAEEAGLEGRTFLRRFQAATTLNPSEYLQQLRVAKARELMELTTQSVDLIAGHVGYEDTSAFRRIFQKITGLTPRDYRRRFSLRPTG